MRVITGVAKGRKIKAPKGMNTRPTSDKVKESMFNIIGHIDSEASVLDLFAGSGNVGIEFLSRGAKECVFIDGNTESIKVINENINTLGFEKQSSVFKNTVERSLDVLSRKKRKFDYIFMDPPYNKDLVEPIIEKIVSMGLLKKDGMMIAEHETRTEIKDEFSNLIRFDQRKYGDTTISFYGFEED